MVILIKEGLCYIFMKSDINDVPEFYTPREVADILKLKKTEKVYAMCRSGLLPAIQIGRLWRINKKQFNHWLDAQLQ